MRVTAALRKYLDELRERATRMAVEARQNPAAKPGAIARVAGQPGMHPRDVEKLWVNGFTAWSWTDLPRPARPEPASFRVGRSPRRLESQSPWGRSPGSGSFSTVSTSTTVDPISTGPGSASWWFRSSDGSLTLWQLPNPALCVWLVTLALGWLRLSPAQATAVDGIGHGALLVWALDEVVRGASPFRRTLGAVVLAAQLATFVLG
jgi:hypothetical protein